jgi:hypothetical protein
MGLNYAQLNETIRRFMMQEFEQGGHYISPRLNEGGRARWIGLLKDALQYHTDVWLERELIRRNCFQATEYLKSTMGKTVTRAVNRDQLAKTLAEGEYNRYYLRGLCLAAKSRGYTHLIVSQGRIIPNAPPASRKSVGTPVEIGQLLNALRTNSFKHVDSALGAPDGLPAPACLSARIPGPGEAFALSQGHYNQ